MLIQMTKSIFSPNTVQGENAKSQWTMGYNVVNNHMPLQFIKRNYFKTGLIELTYQ